MASIRLDEISSPTSSPYKKTITFSDQDLDRFQFQLTRDKIIEVWKRMREGGNSKDGVVTREKFKSIFAEHFLNIKESLIQAIFERFKKRDFYRDERNEKQRNNEKRLTNLLDEKGEIDLYDVAVSLAIMSPLNYDEKLELVFDLTDIDEDGCLSPDDICKMILALERNFAKECSYIDPENASSLHNVATKKAIRRFNYLFLYEGRTDDNATNNDKARKDKVLGHFKDFMEKLSNKQNLYKNLLPQSYSIRRVLENQTKEISFNIHKNEEDSFKKFRAELHGKIWGKTEAELRMKNTGMRKDDIFKLQNKEPGDVQSYGVKTVSEEESMKMIDKQETIKSKDYFVQEKNSSPEHKKRLKDMRDRELPKLDQVVGSKYEKMLKKKENFLPPLTLFSPENQIQSTFERPDLESLVDKRVERLKKTYKHLDRNYKTYLLKKLTDPLEDNKSPSHSSSARKIQAYKLIL